MATKREKTKSKEPTPRTCAHPGCKEREYALNGEGYCFSHAPLSAAEVLKRIRPRAQGEGSPVTTTDANTFAPTWHGPVAQRLRQIYAHRVEHAEYTQHLQAHFPIIGIPWAEWAELALERFHGLKPGESHPFTSIGVEQAGKNYDDAIPVFGRHWEKDGTGGNVYFWFYPVVRS